MGVRKSGGRSHVEEKEPRNCGAFLIFLMGLLIFFARQTPLTADDSRLTHDSR